MRLWYFVLLSSGLAYFANASSTQLQLAAQSQNACSCTCKSQICSCVCGPRTSLGAQQQDDVGRPLGGTGPGASNQDLEPEARGVVERLSTFNNEAAHRRISQLYVAQNLGHCVRNQSISCIQDILESFKTPRDVQHIRTYGAKMVAKGNKGLGSLLQMAGKKIVKAAPLVGIGVGIFGLAQSIRKKAPAEDIVLNSLDVAVAAAQVVLMLAPAIALACPVCGPVLILAPLAIEAARVAVAAIISIISISKEMKEASSEITMSGVNKFRMGLQAFFGFKANMDAFTREANLKKFHRDLVNDVQSELEMDGFHRKFIPTYQFNKNGELVQMEHQKVDLTVDSQRKTFQWAVDLRKDGFKITLPTTERRDGQRKRGIPILMWPAIVDLIGLSGFGIQDGLRPGVGSAKCEQAIGVISNTATGPGTDVFALGDGDDEIVAQRSSTFVVGGGYKIFKGSSEADTFIIDSQYPLTAELDGAGGTDSLAFLEGMPGVGVTLRLSNIEDITGRAGVQETVRVLCPCRHIDLKGGRGGRDGADVLDIMGGRSCAGQVDEIDIYVHANTEVTVRVDVDVYYITGWNNLNLKCRDGCMSTRKFIQIYYSKKTVSSQDQSHSREHYTLVCTTTVRLNDGEKYEYKIEYIGFAYKFQEKFDYDPNPCPKVSLVQSKDPDE